MPKIPDMPLTASDPEDCTPQSARESGRPAVSLVTTHDYAGLSPAVDLESVYDYAELEDAAAEYWLKMDGWTVGEAALLLCAIDPRAINVLQRVGNSVLERLGWPVFFDDLSDLVARAGTAGVLKFPAPPDAVLAWADQKGLRMPAQFIAHLMTAREEEVVSPRPVPRMEVNRQTVLQCVRRMGYEPTALPTQPGRSNPAKQAAKRALTERTAHTAAPALTNAQFERAWQDLRQAGELRDE